MLNFIYYPVSFILWCWHWVFSKVFGDDGLGGGIAWSLSVVFLVFTLRAILYKPFVAQVRSMRKMQEFQPEMAKIRKKYANDKQKQAAEMQRLQKDHGVNPIAGCLPVLAQVPVFIGLFHVLRSFGPVRPDGIPGNLDGSIRVENYFFGQAGVESFNNANLFGAKLGSWIVEGPERLAAAGTSIPEMLVVMIPLMIMAGVFTHITARHSVARQTAAQGENPQTAIMNKLMLYVFPIGVVVGAPFLPLAILIYWVSNNLWTLGQQWIVYRKIDSEEAEKRESTAATQKALAPRPGQKPVRPEQPPADAAPPKRPGSKPVTRKPAAPNAPQKPNQKPNQKPPQKPPQPGAGSKNAAPNGSVDGARPNSSGKATAPTGPRKARKRR
ncbi:MAG: membrane protein insertase YidC [Pseudonocardia sp.]|nr:membrane protein insertase YidC [Pseudonocardia sp.]